MIANLGMRPILLEGLRDEGYRVLRRWLHQVLAKKHRPEPLLLAGEGADEIALGLAQRLMRRGEDALPVPWSWISPEGAGPPEELPAVCIAICGMDDPLPEHLEQLAERSALLVAGTVVPMLKGSTRLLLELSEKRLEECRLLASVGWPIPAEA